MRSKVIFEHPKWPTAAILSKLPTAAILSKFKKKLPYRSEMDRNVIESDFRTSKMVASGHLKKTFTKKLCE